MDKGESLGMMVCAQSYIESDVTDVELLSAALIIAYVASVFAEKHCGSRPLLAQQESKGKILWQSF